MPVVYGRGLLKMSFWVSKKGQLYHLSPMLSGNGQKSLNKFENTQVAVE